MRNKLSDKFFDDIVNSCEKLTHGQIERRVIWTLLSEFDFLAFFQLTQKYKKEFTNAF